MNATWIVSANASRARFFSRLHSSDPLEEVNDMVNEAARLRVSESTESDRLGPTAGTSSVHATGGQVPNKTYEARQTPEEHQAELFARDIADYLLDAYRQGRFQRLCLVVSPQFLGLLRKLLHQELESAVTLEIDKDYTSFNGAELLDHVQAQMTKTQ